MKDFEFEEPVRQELHGVDRYYYTQNLKYQGKDLLLPTHWFTSRGLRESFERKTEIYVPITPEMLSLLRQIEAHAIAVGMKVPVELQPNENVSRESLFKHLPEKQGYFIKVIHDATHFDKLCNPMSIEPNRFGQYRVMIHVKGLYLGYHPSGKVASLQLRVQQTQYIPKIVPCLFSSLPINLQLETEAQGVCVNVPQTPQPTSEPMSLASNNAATMLPPKKKGRKPKLQRQNAMVENQEQQSERRKMESLPSDFFTDLDLTALA